MQRNVAVMVVAGIACAAGVVAAAVLGLRVFAGRGMVDVTGRPEFAASLERLAPVPACSLSYGEPHRGANAEAYRFARVWAGDCDDTWLRVGVPANPTAGGRARFVLERDAKDEPWTLRVDPTAADANTVAHALEAFLPTIVAQAGPMLDAERAERARAKAELDAQDAERAQRREKNAASYR